MIACKASGKSVIPMDDYEVKIVNPEVFKQNKTVQKQFAKWLLEFGLRVGTIRNPQVSEERTA